MIGKTIARIIGDDTLIFTDGTGAVAVGYDEYGEATLEALSHADVQTILRDRAREEEDRWLRNLQRQAREDALRAMTCEERARRRAVAEAEREAYHKANPMAGLLHEAYGDLRNQVNRQIFGSFHARRACPACGETWCPNAVEVEPKPDPLESQIYAGPPLFKFAEIRVEPGEG